MAPRRRAAAEAVRTFHGHRSSEPAEIIESIHLCDSRHAGAALAIARLDLATARFDTPAWAISPASILDPRTGDTTSMVSHNGTVGHAIRKIQSFDYRWTDDSLADHAFRRSGHALEPRSLSRALCRRHPGLIAGVLYRDHKRGRDDVTVVVARPCEGGAAMSMPLLNLEVRVEYDVVLARQRARQIAGLLGFAQLDQTRIATATSEIARNSVQYAGGGRVEFGVEIEPAPAFVIRVLERGPGIKDLQAILEGEYVSPTGPGTGNRGARRLMDRFAIESVAGAGATVVMAKNLPDRAIALTPQELGRISAELAKNAPQGLLGRAPAAEPGVAQHPSGAARKPGRDRPDAQPRAR